MLVVDDEAPLGKVLVGLLRQAGHDAVGVTSAEAALARVTAEAFEVVITDLRMPKMDGMALLDELAQRAPGVPVIMLTAYGSTANVVEAMRRGAADFLSKPFDRDEVIFCVEKALRLSRHAPEQPARVPAGAPPQLGASDRMRALADEVARAARVNSTVLIGGESGAGKEVVARAIHAASPRREGPFVAVHCAALPESLLEAELFGHEKGAFTGAVSTKPGRVELAEGGTLFLDEIGDISPAVQVKLLRLVQEKTYERLGNGETRSADVRLLAATHRDLPAMVDAGEFREDLYFRLAVIPIWVPPLREHRADIGPLARRFLHEIGAANGRPEIALDDGAVERLSELEWRGNVRELSNFVERLVVFVDGARVTAAHVDRELARMPGARRGVGGPVTLNLAERVRQTEREVILAALEATRGNKTQAAKLLGIARRTLHNKLAELGMDGGEA